MVVLIDKTREKPVREICARHGDKPDALLEILNDVQRADGFVSDDALRVVADALNISRAETHGVVSFYHDYRREAPAQHTVKICRAEACQAVGSEQLAAEAEARFQTKTGAQSDDKEIGLEAVYCLGNCALGPAVMIDSELYGRVTPERLEALVQAHISRRENAK